ncbi:MAG: 50S ribosomal protein L5 [Candidatus Aenigmarchaeota archaeon]|nr:50S ribosomal protein L5 [Candidatus Aenigmarchaeota archaeon]
MGRKIEPSAGQKEKKESGNKLGANVMRSIRLEKLTINMSAGDAGPKLEKSQKIMEKIAGKKAVVTKTHKRTTFGMAKGRPIGAKATIRGEAAMELLKKLLKAKENRLKPSQFDSSGNFSFGIHEYFNIHDVKYDPDVGILGMDVCVSLERPGYRVKRRMIRPARIGAKHRITREDAMEWARKELGAVIEEKEE